jgi:hypothetical protein
VSRESRLLAGVLLVTVPSVMFGGMTLLSMLAGRVSTLSPTASAPTALVALAYPGAAALAIAVLTLGVGLLRAARRS